MLGVSVGNVYCNEPTSSQDIQHNFESIKQEFSSNKWDCIRTNSKEIIFKNRINAYDLVEIYGDVGGFRVIIPLKTSTYSYTTRLSTVMDLCDYLKMFLDNYESLDTSDTLDTLDTPDTRDTCDAL